MGRETSLLHFILTARVSFHSSLLQFDTRALFESFDLPNGLCRLSREERENLVRVRRKGEVLVVRVAVAVLEGGGSELGVVMRFSDDDDFEVKRR